jgi:hypothetical protein
MIYDYEAKYNVNINTGSSKSLISDDESGVNNAYSTNGTYLPT